MARVEGLYVVCKVTEGGMVSDNKGLSLPGVAVSVPAMSDKDAADLRFALSMSVDFVALSFVRSARDVELVREIIDEELAAIREQLGADFDENLYQQAGELFTEVALADEYVDFLTLPAYERMP